MEVKPEGFTLESIQIQNNSVGVVLILMSFVIERTFARNYKRERPHLFIRNIFPVLAFSLLLSQYSEQHMPLEVHEWSRCLYLLSELEGQTPESRASEYGIFVSPYKEEYHDKENRSVRNAFDCA